MSDLNPTIDEIWKPVPGYEGLYEISSLGRVKSLPTRPHYRGKAKACIKRLSTRTSKPCHIPYLRVYLSKASKKKNHLVHRLVAMAFIGPPPDAEHSHINHIDADPHNNRPENLEWVSPQQNAAHTSRLGRNKWRDDHLKRLEPERGTHGTDHCCNKLTEEQVLAIRRLYREGSGLTTLSRLYGVSATTITKIVRRERWKHIP